MFKIEDRRPVQFEKGMVIREYINGEFNREFILSDYEGMDRNIFSNDIIGHVIDKVEVPKYKFKVKVLHE